MIIIKFKSLQIGATKASLFASWCLNISLWLRKYLS